MGLAAALVLLMLVPIQGTDAGGDEGALPLLHQLDDCPAAVHTCVVMEGFLVWPEEPSDTLTDHPDVIAVRWDEPGYHATVTLGIRGRLNGGGVRAYHLELNHPREGFDCQDFIVPVVGAGRVSGGTILVQEGVLEIIGSGLALGVRDSVHLIDKESLAVSSRLSPNWHHRGVIGVELVVNFDGRLLWRTPTACLDLEPVDRFRQQSLSSCNGRTLSRASPEDVGRVRRARPFDSDHLNDRLRYDLWEPEDAPFFVFIYGVACT
jgi:hypothetical protein